VRVTRALSTLTLALAALVLGATAAQAEAASGNVYFREGDHWDVVHHSCGC